MKHFFKNLLLGLFAVIIILIIIAIKPKYQNPDNLPSQPNQIEINSEVKTLVKEFQKLSRLETASIKISQNYKATRNNELLWGLFGEELTFFANGEVIAGIDFNSFTENDFQIINQQIISVNLPETMIFNVVIDSTTSHISRTKGILAMVNKNMETDVRIFAQDDFKKIAINSNILFQAHQNAMDSIQELVQKLGYTIAIFPVNN